MMGWTKTLLMTVGLLFGTNVQAVARGASEVIASLQDGIVEIVKSRDNTSFQWRYESFHRLVKQTHDMAFITRLTVHRSWHGFDDGQRANLVDLLERLSAATYASRFKRFADQQFQVLEEQNQPRDTKLVKARLTTVEGKQVDFDYLLHQVDGQWMIINIIVDGVSDLALKRAEYNTHLGNGGYQELVKALDQQIEQAQNK